MSAAHSHAPVRAQDSGARQRASDLATDGVGSNQARVDAMQVPTQVVVEAGDTLWGIAASELADGERWSELAELNGIEHPSRIEPGQVLALPVDAESSVDNVEGKADLGAEAEVEQAPPEAPAVAATQLGQVAEGGDAARRPAPLGGFWARLSGLVADLRSRVSDWVSGWLGGGKDAPEPGTEGPAEDAPVVEEETPVVDTPVVEEDTPVAEPEPVIHTVYPGNNLWSIAQQYLGSGDRWPEIAEANGLADASMLRVGMRLVIPGASAESPTAPVTGPDRPVGPIDIDGDGLGATDPIPRDGLRGLNYTMAGIYNTKGAYLQRKASELGLSTAAAAAVLQIESGGQGFHRDSGDMIVRFENHIFHDQWGSSNRATFDQHFQYSSGQRWTGHKFRESPTDAWASFHGNQSKEWQVLDKARALDDTAALKSISMGAAQIMGFNYKTVGYESVQDMFDSMTVSLPSQLDGMFAFIQANATCMAGLRSNDYTRFARGYNGSGQAAHYGGLIASAAEAYARVTSGRIHA